MLILDLPERLFYITTRDSAFLMKGFCFRNSQFKITIALINSICYRILRILFRIFRILLRTGYK